MTNKNSLTAEELLSRYAAGERSFVGLDLDEPPWLNFSGVDLSGVDFSHSFLVCIFRRANLRNSRFHSANVKTCDFTEADLTGADFTGAALDGTSFVGATLTNACFAGAVLQGIELRGGELPHW